MRTRPALQPASVSFRQGCLQQTLQQGGRWNPAGWRGEGCGGQGGDGSGFSLHLPASVPVMGLKGPDWDEQRWEWAMARLSACMTNRYQVPRFKNNQKKLPTDIGVAKEYSFLLSFQETFKTYRWVFLTTECYRYFRSGLLVARPLALPCLIRTNCCKELVLHLALSVPIPSFPRPRRLLFKMADGRPHGAGGAGCQDMSFYLLPSLQPIVDRWTLSTDAQQELINGVDLTLVIIWMREPPFLGFTSFAPTFVRWVPFQSFLVRADWLPWVS